VVDSSALAEQVVADVLVSAFDSAGQRGSALRVLCLQEEVADRVLTMLRGALAELAVGNPGRLSTNIGSVITAEARDGIEAHIRAMRESGHIVHQVSLPPECAQGTFVAPAIIELGTLSALRREELDAMLDAINATGYGLTFGVHTRIDETVARVTGRARAGNIYVNRNLIGAVVGVQPFGGDGLSGTGPKAGGPLYLRRLLAVLPAETGLVSTRAPQPALEWAAWLARSGAVAAEARFRAMLAATPFGVTLDLPGPVGERNVYSTEPLGTVRCVALNAAEVLHQVGAALATGNRALVAAGALPQLSALPPALAGSVTTSADPEREDVAAILFAGSIEALRAINQAAADRDGPITPVHVAGPDGCYPLEWLVQERCISVNTTAAGGNANLMMIG